VADAIEGTGILSPRSCDLEPDDVAGAGQEIERRLTTILSAGVAGYSGLIERSDDKDAAAEPQSACRARPPGAAPSAAGQPQMKSSCGVDHGIDHRLDIHAVYFRVLSPDDGGGILRYGAPPHAMAPQCKACSRLG
jgi:hypothetical protein